MRRETETQRLALLRLLAGWLAVVVLLSAAPFAPDWTRRVRQFLASVLGRAEAAAQCLLFIQFRSLARDRGIAVDWASFSRRQFDVIPASDGDEPPSLAELRRRLVALRCLLKNLPHRALRALRRLDAVRDGNGDSGPRVLKTVRPSKNHPGVSQCCPPRPWHPPDRVRPLFGISAFSLPPEPERRRRRVAA